MYKRNYQKFKKESFSSATSEKITFSGEEENKDLYSQ